VGSAQEGAALSIAAWLPPAPKIPLWSVTAKSGCRPAMVRRYKDDGMQEAATRPMSAWRMATVAGVATCQKTK
jgi:hypothetical protein